MAGRINQRGWIVLESIASSDALYCVDFIEDPEGDYGFEHFRSDPEDDGRWLAVGGFGGMRFPSAFEAAEAAADEIAWLKTDRRAQVAWGAWKTCLDAQKSDGTTI